MEPISTATAVFGYISKGVSTIGYGLKIWGYKKQDRRERRELREETADIEARLTEAQNSVYGKTGWEKCWKGLDEARVQVYNLMNEAERVPYHGLTWKEIAFDYKEKLDDIDAVKKCLPPLRKELKEFGKNGTPVEATAIASYINGMAEGLRDRHAGVEEYLREFEESNDGTEMAEKSKENRAKNFTADHGQIAADPDVIAYVSASASKVYRNPPDWTPYPKGRHFGTLKADRPKNKKGSTAMRCGRYGIDRIVFNWNYENSPKPEKIADEAESSARWGWMTVTCVVAENFDKSFKEFVQGYASPGMLLFAHEMKTGVTYRDKNPASEAFAPYFNGYAQPPTFKEYMTNVEQRKNGLDRATFRELGFGEKETEKLAEDDLIYETEPGIWAVEPL